MRIGIDIRSLVERYPSGVPVYTKQVISRLVTFEDSHDYHFFYNSCRGLPQHISAFLRSLPATVHTSSMPNKIFNTALFAAGRPYLDTMVGGADVFFMPNIHFGTVSPQCKLVLTVHDLSFRYRGFYRAKQYWWHRFVRPERLINQATAIISVSQSTKQDVCMAYDLDPATIHVTPLGQTAARFGGYDRDFIRSRYGLTKPYILFVGTLEARKNIRGFIQAWRIARKHLSDHVLVLAGKNALMRKSIPRQHIYQLGYVTEQEKAALLQQADAFVYPSYYEGFGLPVLEAMAAGVPVITSFSTSLPEVAGNAALLIDPYNAQEIAKAMVNIVTDRNLRSQLICSGQQQSCRYSWDITARKTAAIINNAANI